MYKATNLQNPLAKPDDWCYSLFIIEVWRYCSAGVTMFVKPSQRISSCGMLACYRHGFFVALPSLGERRSWVMKITKQLNNNIVIASDSQGREIVLMGKGIGFGRKPGMEPDIDDPSNFT